jgi:hypothetical protein
MKKPIRILLLIVPVLLTCSREIGDDCGSNSDCGSGRICDTSQPGGYCTISPCRKGDCPSESVCITFQPESTWCMRECAKNEDCRVNYVCVLGFGDFPGFCDQVYADGSSKK